MLNIEEIIKKHSNEKAIEIYRKYKSTMPFNVVKFANEIGIDVYTDDLPSNVSGKIEKNDGKFVCTINKKNSVNRQIFTIAHELGHYFSHQDWFQQNNSIEEKEVLYSTFRKDQPQEYSQKQKEMEKEANEFAAELLMPAELIRDKWQELKNIQKMARYFGVSIESMSIRLSNVIEDIRFII